MGEEGFSLFELLVVISLLGIFFVLIPGVERIGLTRISQQEEVQHLVDLLRWAQRRAILCGERHYLTLDPLLDQYRIYEIGEDGEVVLQHVSLEGVDLLGINRSVTGMEQTFYFTPQGTSVFGCSISLQGQWTLYKVIIAVGSGKIRIERG